MQNEGIMQHELSIAERIREAVRRLEAEIAQLEEKKSAKRRELQQHKSALRILEGESKSSNL
jgi:Arc/MetJ-type ribon-helix-helix transcriptional regulator